MSLFRYQLVTEYGKSLCYGSMSSIVIIVLPSNNILANRPGSPRICPRTGLFVPVSRFPQNIPEIDLLCGI